MSRIVSKYRFNNQGIFSLKMPIEKFDHWVPSAYIYLLENGIIIWLMDKPDGALIQYPDGVRRFLTRQWIDERGVQI